MTEIKLNEESVPAPLLKQSFVLRPDLAAYSRTDGDHAGLRSLPTYADLIGAE